MVPATMEWDISMIHVDHFLSSLATEAIGSDVYTNLEAAQAVKVQ